MKKYFKFAGFVIALMFAITMMDQSIQAALTPQVVYKLIPREPVENLNIEGEISIEFISDQELVEAKITSDLITYEVLGEINETDKVKFNTVNV